jgi:molybdate transport system regulatory protein
MKSVRNMGLTIGCDLYAIIKSSDVTIVTAPPKSDEAMNALKGTINRIESQDETDEITFALDLFTRALIALMNPKDTTQLSEGMNAYALISPNYYHIIIKPLRFHLSLLCAMVHILHRMDSHWYTVW